MGRSLDLYSINNTSKKILSGYILEQITAKIFENSGYEIIHNNYSSDVVAKNDDIFYYIEVKGYTSAKFKHLSMLNKTIRRLVDFSKEDGIPVLCVYSVIPEKIKNEYISLYSTLIIFDISNLLYMAESTGLKTEMIAALPYSVDQILPKESAIKLSAINHCEESSNLLKKLDDCTAGISDAIMFEDICVDVLKYIFSEDLSLWQKQKKSNNDLYRFDLLCRIKDNNYKTFWSMMNDFFNSKYIIFEFKNYTNQITQKEVYTTERYLYAKALRNVAIIVAKNGFDDNSTWAAKGSLREYGKLILLLTIDDIKTMYNMKKEQDDPSEFLLNKLDAMLSELEK